MGKQHTENAFLGYTHTPRLTERVIRVLRPQQEKTKKANNWGFNQPDIKAQPNRIGLRWDIILQFPTGCDFPLDQSFTLTHIVGATQEEVEDQLFLAHQFGVIWFDAFVGFIYRTFSPVQKGARDTEYTPENQTKLAYLKHAMKHPRQRYRDPLLTIAKEEEKVLPPIDRGLITPGEKRRLKIIDQAGRDFCKRSQRPLHHNRRAFVDSFPTKDSPESLIAMLRRLPDMPAGRIATYIEEGWLRVEGDYIYRVAL